LGHAASGHSAFPARSTGTERELSRFHVLLRRMSPQLAPHCSGLLAIFCRAMDLRKGIRQDNEAASRLKSFYFEKTP
jgi:hypothetical protein